MKEKPYEQLSYRGRWNRWKRHQSCRYCRAGYPCENPPPHPGETKEQRHERVVNRLHEEEKRAKWHTMSWKEKEAFDKRPCASCGKLLSWYFNRKLCGACRLKAINESLVLVNCYNCLTVYKGSKCPDCATPYNQAKQKELLRRRNKSYKDIVRENQRRGRKSRQKPKMKASH